MLIIEVRRLIQPAWKFSLGQVVATPGVLERIPNVEIIKSLIRHANADWGELGEEDATTNNQALQYGNRLLSSYRSGSGAKFWIITEADRTVTTVLLPEEY